MAPRSRGCRNCVQRRVKCDERRPQCEKCLKMGIQCDGFRDHLVFVDETQQTLERLVPPQTDQSSHEPLAHRSLPNLSSAIPGLTSSRELGLAGPPEDVYIPYLLQRFIATGDQHQDYNGNAKWIKACLSKQEDNPTSSLALKCLATSFFGRQYRQDAIMREASRLYSQSLRALCQTLQHPQQAWTFDALAAITALNFYEYIVFTTRKGWIQHVQGVARLMEARGAQSFKKYPDKAILDMSKPMLCAHALAARRRTFLEDEEWHSGYTPGYPVLMLEDLFTRLPGIAETVQGFESSMTDSMYATTYAPGEFERAHARISSLVFSLNKWYQDFIQARGDGPSEIRSESGTGLTNDDEGPLFNTIFEFKSLQRANEVAMYWMIKSAALEWQYKLSHLSWQRGDDNEGMLAIPEAAGLAINICRSVEYHLRPVHVQAGAFYILMPARVAYRTLPTQSREARWLRAILKRIADRSGFEIARNVLNIPLRKGQPIERKSHLEYSPANSTITESNLQSVSS